MKARAIIQARMGSSRLRGKSLMPIAGKPLLNHVIEMVKSIEFIDEVILATTQLEEDVPLEAMASTLGVKVVKGSALNLLERFYYASADLNENDCVVRFTADNLWNNKALSKKVFDIHINHNNDYTHIDGLSHIVAEFIRVRALREAYNEETLTAFDKEHVTPIFRRKKKHYKVETLSPSFGGLRQDLDNYLTVDTLEDLHRIEGIINALMLKANPINFDKVYEYLDNNIAFIPDEAVGQAMKLAGVPVGDGYPTYIIAEIGQNHNGDIQNAEKLIDMAVRCGANAVKFQKRDIPSELTKEAYDKPYENPNSFGKTYGEHREFLELNEEQHQYLREYALAKGIDYFCTPCDVPSVELLERIGCPFYKVASRDLTNLPLLEKLGSLNKPVILSTGMADINDINDALKALSLPKNKICILQCTSEYPCKLENVNLKAMATLKKEYDVVVGLSDHTSGVIISSAAASIGAHIIEKHITLDRTMKGTDQPGSLEEAGLKKLVEYIRSIEIAMGDGVKDINPATKTAKVKLARSITSKEFIAKGTLITKEMLTLKSPGDGFKWKDINKVVGKIANQNIEVDVTIRSEYLD